MHIRINCVNKRIRLAICNYSTKIIKHHFIIVINILCSYMK